MSNNLVLNQFFLNFLIYRVNLNSQSIITSVYIIQVSYYSHIQTFETFEFFDVK